MLDAIKQHLVDEHSFLEFFSDAIYVIVDGHRISKLDISLRESVAVLLFTRFGSWAGNSLSVDLNTTDLSCTEVDIFMCQAYAHDENWVKKSGVYE